MSVYAGPCNCPGYEILLAQFAVAQARIAELMAERYALRSEIERLTAEREEMRKSRDHHASTIFIQSEMIERNRVDADRYRWLRQFSSIDTRNMFVKLYPFGPALDAAIDAAIRNEVKDEV